VSFLLILLLFHYRNAFKTTLREYIPPVPVAPASDAPADDADDLLSYAASKLRASIAQPTTNADTEVANYLASPIVTFGRSNQRGA